MKYLKMLGLAALAAGALMALTVSSASATELDCSASTMCTAPTTIHSVNVGIVKLDSGAFPIECEESAVQGKASTGGSSETPSGAIESLSFSKCGSWSVTPIAGHLGSLEVHTKTASSDGNGTLTGFGTEVTVEGFGLHCIYGPGASPGMDLGTITGSRNTGSTAHFHIEAEITRLGGRSGPFCPGPVAQWTGTYKIDTPDYLDVT